MIGAQGDPARASRLVQIQPGEMFFSLDVIEARESEAIRFVLSNTGKAVHEFSIGAAEMHAVHKREMIAKMKSGALEVDRTNHDTPGAVEHHDPNSVLPAPGETGEAVWRFSAEADPEFSCNVRGRRASGMAGKFVFAQ